MPNILSIEQSDNVTIVRFQSSFLDCYASEWLGKVIQFLAGQSAQPNFVLSLDNVQYFGAHCFGKLLEIHKSIFPKGGAIRFCFTDGFTSELFEIVGFNNLFEVYATEEEALESFRVQRRQSA